MSNNTENKASLMKMCKADEVILHEGEVNTEMYKILSGKAAMYMHYGEENEYLIGIISDQRCIGDVSLLTNRPSPYTVVAVSNVMLMRIQDTQFEEFIVNNTKNAVDIMKNMASMIVTLNKDIDLITDELSYYIKELENKNEQSEDMEVSDVLTAIQNKIMQHKMATLAGNTEPV